jgi:hypothetical protein
MAIVVRIGSALTQYVIRTIIGSSFFQSPLANPLQFHVRRSVADDAAFHGLESGAGGR